MKSKPDKRKLWYIVYADRGNGDWLEIARTRTQVMGASLIDALNAKGHSNLSLWAVQEHKSTSLQRII